MSDLPEVRASDADRERVVEHLRRHMSEGRLALDEFEERAARAYGARTAGELVPLLSDLPDAPEPPRPAGPPVRQRPPSQARAVAAEGGLSALMMSTAFRIHFYLWVVLSAFWIVIWLATGGDGGFWPIFPIAGFGLTVGIHGAIRLALASPGPSR
jgi:hypothetical protein